MKCTANSFFFKYFDVESKKYVSSFKYTQEYLIKGH